MIPDLTPAEIRRFYSKIQLGGCGLHWAGPFNNKGYGRFEFYRNGKRRRVLAHRLACKLFTGEDPGGAVVRHECDTPRCCTPDCLLAGTQADNMRDAAERGRANYTGLLIPQKTRRAAAAERVKADMKTCARCRQGKPLAGFSRHSGNTDGHQGECKDCLLDRNRERRQLERETAPRLSTSGRRQEKREANAA
jgi:HNH endonuclease